jgi:hypothetical protein
MRLWTIHPRFLDAKGLVALWREALLAKAVLEGNTKGYKKHPQLIRFQDHKQPVEALCQYLHAVLAEAYNRGYHFDAKKLPAKALNVDLIEETKGQLDYEWQHFINKLRIRDPAHYHLLSPKLPEPHPLFRIVPGDVKDWEKITYQSR